MAFDAKAIKKELDFLKKYPHFDQRPASIMEFLGEDYLNIDKKVRPGLKVALSDIFGKDANGDRIGNFERAMITGGIGIGKTTFASIALPYMAHWVLCLRDPQDFLSCCRDRVLPSCRCQRPRSRRRRSCSATSSLASSTRSGSLRTTRTMTSLLSRFASRRTSAILPGDSSETTFEGYNILAGILDEMDSHQQTRDKDYADVGFDTIHSRIASRFIDEDNGGHKGLLIAIGQMKKGDGFAARKYNEFLEDDKAYVVRMTIWESLGWQRFLKPDGTRDSFWYDIKRKQIIPSAVAGVVDNKDFIEVPTAYKKDFTNNPEKALRDLAGIPPATNDPFISLTHKIDEAVEKWKERHREDSPVDDNPTRPKFADWFTSNGDPRRRAVHLDLATSGDGDALGLAMGHIEELVEVEGELQAIHRLRLSFTH